MKTHSVFLLVHQMLYDWDVTGCLLHRLTVLSHQNMGHVLAGFHQGPQEVECGLETFQAVQVTQLDKERTHLKSITTDAQLCKGTCLEANGKDTHSVTALVISCLGCSSLGVNRCSSAIQAVGFSRFLHLWFVVLVQLLLCFFLCSLHLIIQVLI